MTPKPPENKALKVLGSGSHGTVYEIRNGSDDRFALKIFHAETILSDSDLESLRFLLTLRHPYLLTPDRIGFLENRQLFLRYRLVEQTDPRQLVARDGPTAALTLLF